MGDLSSEAIRHIYSLQDFQMAMSAAEFLSELGMDKTYSKIEMKKYKCYETTMITAYARPFSQSHGDTPKLTLSKLQIQLSEDQMALHKELLELRNKVFAHSDGDRMRMRINIHSTGSNESDKLNFPEFIFEEGVNFLGVLEMNNVMNLIHLLVHALVKILFPLIQNLPDDFSYTKDYLYTE